MKRFISKISLKVIVRTLGMVIILVALGFLLEFCYTRYMQSRYNQENEELITEFLNNFNEDEEYVEEETTTTTSSSTAKVIGLLEIDAINLKVGFYSKDSYRNNVKYGLQILEESQMPDEIGQFIVASHRGTSAVSYFGKLHKLEIGAEAKVYYKNKIYTYKLVETDEQDKTGTLVIKRSVEYPLVLVTCTQATNGKTQTIYYFTSTNVEEKIVENDEKVESEVELYE